MGIYNTYALEVVEAIIDTIFLPSRKRPPDPITPPSHPKRRRIHQNPQATFSDPHTPWHHSETVAGPAYGTSRRSRTLKRPLHYEGAGRHCPMCTMCHQPWELTMDPRPWNVPVRPGECGVCGQQKQKRSKPS